jgi:arylsulfatase A-like enzyme
MSERISILKSQRLANLDLGEEFVLPHYSGNSILSIPTSLCTLFNVPGLRHAGLDKNILSEVSGDIQKVILILMDGLAFQRLQRWIEDGTAPVWNSLIERGVLAPLTSVSPSTTSTAITSIWTGCSPREHGIVGYELWLKEYGIVSNMILQTPMSFHNNGSASGHSLNHAGFKTKEFLQIPTLGNYLKAHGVQVSGFQHHSILYSGFTQMLMNDVNLSGYGTVAELWLNLREWLENNNANRQYKKRFAWVYWAEVDHLSHRNGPDDERPAAEFAVFSQTLERFFLNKLSPSARRKTLLILTADHGQIHTSLSVFSEMRSHPLLNECLHINPTGENRMVYLHVKPGRIKTVREYVEQTWKGQFQVFNSSDLVESGLFGAGQSHPDLSSRMGDLTLIPHSNQYLWWASKENHLIGRHGGLHEEEMIVPFLAARLD